MKRFCPLLLAALFVLLLLGCDAPPAGAPSASAPPPGPPPPPGAPAASAPASGTPVAPPAAAPPPPAVDLTNVQPDIRLSALELGRENEAGPAVADAKYGGKVIEVDGIVMNYGGRWEQRRPVGEFVGVGAPNEIATFVRCEFAESQLWKKIAKTSHVKIKGRWKSTPQPTIERSTLTDCVFTEVGPNPRINVSAEDLSAQARENRDQFRAKYAVGAEFLVSGEVAGIERGGGGNNVCLVLKTSAAPRILVEQISNAAEVEAKMKADLPLGTKVSIVGAYNDAVSVGKPDVYLNGMIHKE